MERTLSWIHISDLHLTTGDTYDQDVVVESLLKDVEKQRNGNEEADCIFLTGDLAYGGKQEEFAVARRFVTGLSQASGIGVESIFCVPGNHDVNRERLPDELHTAARGLKDRQQVTELLGSSEQRARFADRYAPYTAFVREVFPWARDITPGDLSYTLRRTFNGIGVAIVGLSSAWTAGGRDDKGNLLVGERQVREALKEIGEPQVLVALVHHPLSYLMDFDASDVQALLNRRCDFVLHGHLHETEAARFADPDSELFYFAASAAYDNRREGLGYNRVTVDLDDGRASVALRRYADKGFWAPDTSAYERAPDGILHFHLPERISGLPTRAAVSEVRERITVFTPAAEAAAVPPDLPVPEPPRDLVQRIHRREVVLFAGAGASMDAKLPSWREMMDDLIERLESFGDVSAADLAELRRLVATGELFIAANFCRGEMGEKNFADYLKERLSDAHRSSRTHRILAEIPFRGAVTTNFDPFLERSRLDQRVELVLPDRLETGGSVAVDDLLRDDDLFPVFKLHGSYTDVDSIILTAREFRAAMFEKRRYRDAIKRVFTDCTLFFYGYSFRDPSISHVLMEVMADTGGKARQHHALMPEFGAIAQKYWRENFNVRVISYPMWNGSHVAATAFLEKLAAASRTTAGP